MLVLTRGVEQGKSDIVIAGTITVKVLKIKGNRVTLGIIAPDGVTINRQELVIAAPPDEAPTESEVS